MPWYTAMTTSGARVNEGLVARSVPQAAPLFVVLNVGSGKNDATQVRALIEAHLGGERELILTEVHEPTALGACARQAVERARQRGGIVVAAGGDGTINTVAQATLGSGCFFGVLPLGTFNYFSRAHGIPSDIAEACQILLGTQAFEVQVGLLNERVFLVNSSIGLYPDLLEEREQAKSHLGRSRLVATGAALHTLFTSHRRLRLDIESKQGRRSILTQTLFVGNNRLQLERVGIPQSEQLEHHRLVAVVLKPVSVLGMLGLILRALFGRLGDAQNVISFNFERMAVRRRLRGRRFKVALDGEIEWLAAPLVFRVAPHPLLLLRPKERRDDPG